MFEVLRKQTPIANENRPYNSTEYVFAMEELVVAVQELSHARTFEDILEVVRIAGRQLTGADGATFVLKDGNQCYYVDENAIGPLWKGKRFPMTSCISGWVMMNKKAAAIEDIYADERIPADAYRPTFVKSLVMVPVRKSDPVAAIGNYWSTNHKPSEYEISILQALADTTSVAMESVSLYSELQGKIKALQEANDELAHFASVITYDMKDPLHTIKTNSRNVSESFGSQMDDAGRQQLEGVIEKADMLQGLIKDLIAHASIFKLSQFSSVDSNKLMDELIEYDLYSTIKLLNAKVMYRDLPWVWGNQSSLSRLFYNIISHSMTTVEKGVVPEIRIICIRERDKYKFTIFNNSRQIKPEHFETVFELSTNTGPGIKNNPTNGISLATCKKIVELHGGTIWLEANEGLGNVFNFTLSPSTQSHRR